MTISVVNGFVCASSCDVAKAKKGEDPHPLTGAAKIAEEKAAAASDPAKAGDPAVVFGGALARLSATEAVQPIAAGRPAGPANLQTHGSVLDVRA